MSVRVVGVVAVVVLAACASRPRYEPHPCEQPLPHGTCELGATQRCGDVLCRCVASMCSGAEVDPAAPPPRPLWECRSFPDPCPPSSPNTGAACSPDELVCDYAPCGGSIATCSDGRWRIRYIDPPP